MKFSEERYKELLNDLTSRARSALFLVLLLSVYLLLNSFGQEKEISQDELRVLYMDIQDSSNNLASKIDDLELVFRNFEVSKDKEFVSLLRHCENVRLIGAIYSVFSKKARLCSFSLQNLKRTYTESKISKQQDVVEAKMLEMIRELEGEVTLLNQYLAYMDIFILSAGYNENVSFAEIANQKAGEVNKLNLFGIDLNLGLGTNDFVCLILAVVIAYLVSIGNEICLIAREGPIGRGFIFFQKSGRLLGLLWLLFPIFSVLNANLNSKFIFSLVMFFLILLCITVYGMARFRIRGEREIRVIRRLYNLLE